MENHLKPKHIEKILKDLSLWDKKDQRLKTIIWRNEEKSFNCQSFIS